MRWVLKYQPRTPRIMSKIPFLSQPVAHHSRRPAKGYVSWRDKKVQMSLPATVADRKLVRYNLRNSTVRNTNDIV